MGEGYKLLSVNIIGERDSISTITVIIPLASGFGGIFEYFTDHIDNRLY